MTRRGFMGRLFAVLGALAFWRSGEHPGRARFVPSGYFGRISGVTVLRSSDIIAANEALADNGDYALVVHPDARRHYEEELGEEL